MQRSNNLPSGECFRSEAPPPIPWWLLVALRSYDCSCLLAFGFIRSGTFPSIGLPLFMQAANAHSLPTTHRYVLLHKASQHACTGIPAKVTKIPTRGLCFVCLCRKMCTSDWMDTQQSASHFVLSFLRFLFAVNTDKWLTLYIKIFINVVGFNLYTVVVTTKNLWNINEISRVPKGWFRQEGKRNAR